MRRRASQPIYETLRGLEAARRAARAPGRSCRPQAVKYVRRIEELIERPVTLLSTSPERDDTILMNDPFED